eukprot:COSAG02_NODE_8893_length_2406_cov_1.256610_4_plen_155_part_00
MPGPTWRDTGHKALCPVSNGRQRQRGPQPAPTIISLTSLCSSPLCTYNVVACPTRHSTKTTGELGARPRGREVIRRGMGWVGVPAAASTATAQKLRRTWKPWDGGIYLMAPTKDVQQGEYGLVDTEYLPELPQLEYFKQRPGRACLIIQCSTPL